MYTSYMAQNVMLDRTTGGGRYEDVIDVCEVLADGNLGSSANALAVMARQSPLFRKTVEDNGTAGTTETGLSKRARG